MASKTDCSIKDTSILKTLILDNPDLPVLLFVGEEAYSGEYAYEQANASKGEIETLTLYDDMWLNEEDYRDKLSDDLCDEEEYKDLSDEEYEKMLDQKIAETEFVKAIVIWVGQNHASMAEMRWNMNIFKRKKKSEINKKQYNYLLSYGFSRKVGDNLKYTEGGTGRTILALSKEIKTQKDIIDVENTLRETVGIDNLTQFSLYSFSLLG